MWNIKFNKMKKNNFTKKREQGKQVLKVIFITVILFTNLSVFAQESYCGFSWGVKSGINISNLITEGKLLYDDKDISARYRYIGGGFINYRFSRTFFLSGDVLFSSKGFKVAVPLEELNINLSNVRFRLNYLDIPVLANFYVYKGFALKIGLQPSYLLSARVKEKNLKHSVSVRRFFRKFDCSMPMGMSYDFDWGLIIDARYSLGASGILKAYKKEDWNNNSVFSFTVGVRI